MSANDGGPAFPVVTSGEASESRFAGTFGLRFDSAGGMSLRDYFAAQAMAGFIQRGSEKLSPSSLQLVAKVGYELADCMLAERGKGQS